MRVTGPGCIEHRGQTYRRGPNSPSHEQILTAVGVVMWVLMDPELTDADRDVIADALEMIDAHTP